MEVELYHDLVSIGVTNRHTIAHGTGGAELVELKAAQCTLSLAACWACDGQPHCPRTI